MASPIFAAPDYKRDVLERLEPSEFYRVPPNSDVNI
jgi:hypothetical protein